MDIDKGAGLGYVKTHGGDRAFGTVAGVLILGNAEEFRERECADIYDEVRSNADASLVEVLAKRGQVLRRYGTTPTA